MGLRDSGRLPTAFAKLSRIYGGSLAGHAGAAGLAVGTSEVLVDSISVNYHAVCTLAVEYVFPCTTLGPADDARRGGSEVQDMVAAWGGGLTPPNLMCHRLGGGSDPPHDAAPVTGGRGCW